MLLERCLSSLQCDVCSSYALHARLLWLARASNKCKCCHEQHAGRLCDMRLLAKVYTL